MSKLNKLKAFEIEKSNETKGGAKKSNKYVSESTGWKCYSDYFYFCKNNNESKNDEKNERLDHFEPICNP